MKKDPIKYPSGWSEEKALEIAGFYDGQSEAEIVAEIDAALADEQTVLVQVPRDILPAIRKLIDQRKKTA